MLVEYAEVADAPHYEVLESAATAQQMDALAAQLANARKPIAILGGTRWNQDAVDRFAAFADRHQLPVAVQFRRQMLFSTAHPCFVGDVGLGGNRSEEHTSELQSLMRISYAVFCLKKKNTITQNTITRKHKHTAKNV